MIRPSNVKSEYLVIKLSIRLPVSVQFDKNVLIRYSKIVLLSDRIKSYDTIRNTWTFELICLI